KADGVVETEAVRLFLQRARLVRRGWSPANAELCTLGDIVRRLEGSPLAIELCATRLSTLGTAQVLERLAQPLDLLTDGAHSAPGRHSSLRAAIDVSWQLLDPACREVLARCAVFRGGFDLAALGPMLAPLMERDVRAPLMLLEELCDRSLVR